METERAAAAAFDENDAPPGAVAPESAPASDLAAELAAANALAVERLNELAYARAEIENVRKRATRAAEDRLNHSKKSLLAKFLPVLDNLQRALAFDDSEGLRGGLGATLRGFEGILAGETIVAIETVGKPFDPHVAEAIATRESSEHDDDVVVEEVQRGYRMGDDLLRPAMVIVAKRIDS